MLVAPLVPEQEQIIQYQVILDQYHINYLGKRNYHQL